jgi:hypothetical protein
LPRDVSKSSIPNNFGGGLSTGHNEPGFLD